MTSKGILSAFAVGVIGTAAALYAQTPTAIAPQPVTTVPQVADGDPAMGTKPVKKMKEIKATFLTHDGQPGGSATLKPEKTGGVRVKVELQNMPFGPHAIHLHQNAVCTGPDFKSAGGHFNPTARQHGFDNPAGHHAGDVNTTIQVGEDHRGSAKFVMKDVTWKEGEANSIFANGGTSLVVHEKADDQKTDPSGASGNRIACAVVK